MVTARPESQRSWANQWQWQAVAYRLGCSPVCLFLPYFFFLCVCNLLYSSINIVEQPDSYVARKEECMAITDAKNRSNNF